MLSKNGSAGGLERQSRLHSYPYNINRGKVDRMKVERVDHIHYYVKDVESTVTAFEKLVGIDFWTFQGGQKVLDITAEHGVKLGHNPLGFEVLQVTDQSKRGAQWPSGPQEGIFAISFKVPDIEASVEELKKQGFKVVLPLVQTGGVKEALLESSNIPGIQIELCEYKGDDITAAAGVLPE